MSVENTISNLEKYVGCRKPKTLGGYRYEHCNFQNFRNRVPIQVYENWYIEAVDGDVWFISSTSNNGCKIATLVQSGMYIGWIAIEDDDGYIGVEIARRHLEDVGI